MDKRKHVLVFLFSLILCSLLVFAQVTELGKLTASDQLAFNFLGFSTSISGNTIASGALGVAVGGNSNQGAAYVFVKSAGGWTDTTQTAELTASDGQAQDQFGAAISVDRDVIVVGADNANVGRNAGQGAAYVYIRPQSGWTNTSHFSAKLTASDGAAGDEFGVSAVVSGNTIVVGAPGANSHQGAAYLFVQPASGWTNMTETAKLTASDALANWQLGISVGISGTTVVIGSYGAGRSLNEGAAYVYVEPWGGWMNMAQTAKLTASDSVSGAELGESVSIEGDTVVAGARFDPVSGDQSRGAVYVFVEPSGGWSNATQTAKLIASDGMANDWFGQAVSLSGKTLAVGALGVAGGRGAAYLFAEPSTGWRNTSHFAAKLMSLDGVINDQLGLSLALTRSALAVGSPCNGCVDGLGAVYVFGR